MTTTDNIREFCNIHCEGLPKEDKDNMIKELTDLVNCAVEEAKPKIMKTKEEIKKDLLDLEGFDFEAFEFENEFSAKGILRAMDEYAAQAIAEHLSNEPTGSAHEKKLEILNWIFKSKDGASWNEVAEMLNEFKQLAIAEHEQSEWKKYPDNKPLVNKLYLVELRNGYYKLAMSYSGRIAVRSVIAFRELPTPYTEEGGDDEI